MVTSKTVTVGTGPTVVHQCGPAGAAVIVRNPSGLSDVHLGGEDVTTSNGLTVAAGTSTPLLQLGPSDTLYAVAAASQQVRVLVLSV